MWFRALLALTFPFAGVALAEGPILQKPIDCDLNTTCFIQQYIDHDPSPAARDYRCSPLSYDGHSGTDFALPSLAMMHAGVNVLAAADGIVAGTRDGMPDAGFTAETADSIAGRECGNGVRIDHADGWSTQYCHMKQGSVAVRKNQQITAGTPLGQVGKSGRAAFPHLHLSLRKNGNNVDPFDPDGKINCATPDDNTHWKQPPGHRPGGIISLGLSDHIPNYEQVKAGTAAMTTLTRNAPALVFWSYQFGTQSGDTLHLSLIGPTGTIVQKIHHLEKTQAQSYRAIGKKRRNTNWPSGDYNGVVKLIRAGEEIDQRHIKITLP